MTTPTKEPAVTTPQQPRSDVAVIPKIAAPVSAWTPFALMDSLDAEALSKEMQGIASDVLVYRIKEPGKKEDTVGLSKAGIDECCTMLVQQGMVIREEEITHTIIGDGDKREAFFQCRAARYAVDPNTGREVRLDAVIGTKREPLYEERAPLTLDSRVPGRRWSTAGRTGGHLTYREAIDPDHPVNEPTERDPLGSAVSYLHWIVEASSFDSETKGFVAAILNGEEVGEWEAGKRFNPFWFEHGAMKAARNARFRMIPAEVRAAVLALAKQTGRELERDLSPQQRQEQADRRAAAPSRAERQPRKPDYVRRDPDVDAVAWIFSENRGVPIDAKRGSAYVISDNDLQKALKFFDKGLRGEPVRKMDNTVSPLSDAERENMVELKKAFETELLVRMGEPAKAERPAEPTDPTPPPADSATDGGSSERAPDAE